MADVSYTSLKKYMWKVIELVLRLVLSGIGISNE